MTKPTIDDFIRFFRQLPDREIEQQKMHAWSERALSELLRAENVRVHSNGEKANIIWGASKEEIPLQPEVRLFCQQEIARWPRGGISTAQAALELARQAKDVSMKLSPA